MKAECSIYGWHGDFKAHLIAFRTIESELFWEKTQRDMERARHRERSRLQLLFS